jgi:hypothetical protein
MPIRQEKHAISRLIATALSLALILAPATAHARKASADHGVRRTSRASESRRGRPRKFFRPSRAVTVTLPDDVIAALQTVNTDLSRAVVTVLEPHSAANPPPIAELVGDASQTIVVPPNRALQERAGVELIPLPDGRALISFDDTLSASHIELRLADAMADPLLAADDRAVFVELADILRRARRDGTPSLQQRSIIVLHRTRALRPSEDQLQQA